MKPPRVIRTARALRSYLDPPRRQGKKIGLVPTMGALHRGHLSLVLKARRECPVVVVSIFVNPTQFGPQEDFKKYPRNLARDLKLLAPCGPLVVFHPSVSELYGAGDRSRVAVEGPPAEGLEGLFRPGHFQGVATVVAKLFNLVMPDAAYFGLKDYQQFRVVQAMAQDLHFAVAVKGCATVREKDGLALSSRNAFLSPFQRRQAPALYRALRLAAGLVEKGAGPAAAEKRAWKELKTGGFRPQYLRIVDPLTLCPAKAGRAPVLVAAAAYLGKTRLIDNILVRRG